MSVRRIDLVVLHWDGSKTRRQGVTAHELAEVVRELHRLSNVQPMEFARPMELSQPHRDREWTWLVRPDVQRWLWTIQDHGERAFWRAVYLGVSRRYWEFAHPKGVSV